MQRVAGDDLPARRRLRLAHERDAVRAELGEDADARRLERDGLHATQRAAEGDQLQHGRPQLGGRGVEEDEDGTGPGGAHVRTPLRPGRCG
ncbi:Uncharacterised protein [Mycobacteroides abscessus]|nr:Uncharacterised protein [Mycobacteroides abscessus]